MKQEVKIFVKKRFFSLFFVVLTILALPASLFAQQFYWENPAVITKTEARFPVTVTNGTDSLIFWEEVDSANRQIYITARRYDSLDNFWDNERFAGPFSYSGNEVPQIFSAAMLDDGTVAVAVNSGAGKISVYTSTDRGVSYQQKTLATGSMMIAPRLYATKAGTFKMFTSVGETDSFTIFASDSSDGLSWSKFSQFSPASGYRNPFIPALVSISQTEDLVVFQSQYISMDTNRFSYQLYATKCTKDGRGKETWSQPILITNEKSLSGRYRKDFSSYQNQMASLYNYKGTIYLTWERTDTVASSLWCAQLSENGIVPGTSEVIANQGNASRGIFFEYDDSLYLEWFDTRRGKESIYLAKKDGVLWQEVSLVEDKNANTFPYPVLIPDRQSKKSLSFIFQQTTPSNKNGIAMLSPDKSVLPPALVPLNYKKGKHSKQNNVQYQITFPSDSSNIAGYVYSWSKDVPVVPSTDDSFYFPKEKKVTVKASEDGEYYFSVRVKDYAGNWSEPAVISYYLDLTPPLPPAIQDTNLDKYGFINSNTFKMNWLSSESDDVDGYVYRLDYVGSIPKNIAVSKNHPMRLSASAVKNVFDNLQTKFSSAALKKRKMGTKVQTRKLASETWYNKTNGVYAFSVSAVDEVGNVSEPAVKMIILNKFQPSTYLSAVEQEHKDTGDTVLLIHGGGFTYDGTISQIFIDSDGKAPYDLVLSKENNDYKVQNDNYISEVNIGVSLDEGTYRIGLYHTDRGLYFSGPVLKIAQNGTLKIESEYQLPKHYTSDFKHYKYRLVINTLIIISLILIIALSLIVVLSSSVFAIFNKKLFKKEISSLISGGSMPLSKIKQKLKHQPTLRRKLIGFIFALVVFVVVLVTLQNGFKVISLQEQTMASALENRAGVLLESLCSGVKNFFPANNILELSALPSQKNAMDEVEYVTIIGQPMNSNSSENLNYIWATNDSDIIDKMDSYNLTYGESKLTDEVILNIISGFYQNDSELAEKLNEISTKIDDISSQANLLYASSESDDLQRAEDLSSTVVELRNEMDQRLSQFAGELSGSYPKFDKDNLDYNNTEYIFYKPVLYRKGTSGNYIHGLVYLQLSTQSLIDSIHAETLAIITFGVIVAIVAVIVGIFGASLFSLIIVKPLRKLETHVMMIGHTKNKLNLKGRDVELKSKDEVGRLGDAINNMTHELIAVAEEEALAMDGKAVQKAFLPLEDAGLNNKKTIAELNEKDIQCFGYYEGESGVSGDYFDYRRLDENWFVIIKCDVSGHGIPAAIIMTVVATLFRRYFEKWSFAKKGTNLNVLVEQINDFIEGLGLKGKFATLILCLLNTKTGELYMCNAGDNLVHIYDSESHEFKTITLSSAPTAGIFTSDLVAMRGGFKVEKTILKKGDTLFLYTDGIEESTRRIRNSLYQVQQNTVEVKKMNPQTHQEEIEYKTEDAKEEFGPERIKQIVEAVFKKEKYILTKAQNPNASEVLEFDFTNCEGTISEAILALTSLEKVYRLYKSPDVQTTDYIKIDKKIDEFLSRYFNMYDYYSANKTEDSDGGNYIDYDQIQEDEQSDDLTMLAIRRI